MENSFFFNDFFLLWPEFDNSVEERSIFVLKFTKVFTKNLASFHKRKAPFWKRSLNIYKGTFSEIIRNKVLNISDIILSLFTISM